MKSVALNHQILFHLYVKCKDVCVQHASAIAYVLC